MIKLLRCPKDSLDFRRCLRHMSSNKIKISLNCQAAKIPRKINLYIKIGVSSFTGNFVLSSSTLSKKENAIELGKFVIT